MNRDQVVNGWRTFEKFMDSPAGAILKIYFYSLDGEGEGE